MDKTDTEDTIAEEAMSEPEIATILYRVEALERQNKDLTTQLDRYVLARENDLRLQTIQASMARMENDVSDTKKQLIDLNVRLSSQKAEQQDAQNKLLIKVLWGAVSLVIVTLLTILTSYITHFF